MIVNTFRPGKRLIAKEQYGGGGVAVGAIQEIIMTRVLVRDIMMMSWEHVTDRPMMVSKPPPF